MSAPQPAATDFSETGQLKFGLRYTTLSGAVFFSLRSSMNATRLELPLTVAVLGNPNTGKSTLFNALTGSTQRTGNYPGVTVERRTGRLKYGDLRLQMIDLPGTYSLAPKSPDEMVSIQVLLGTGVSDRAPDLIVCVVDASNLSRNLFLVSQILDLRRPVVIALNMVDIARRRGIEIDTSELERVLGVPVIAVQANRRLGMDALKQAIVQSIHVPPRIDHEPFALPLRERLDRLQEKCPDDCRLKRFVVARMLFDGDGFMSNRLGAIAGPALVETAEAERRELVAKSGLSVSEEESRARYDWISSHRDRFVKQVSGESTQNVSVALDAILTHRFWGFVIAAVVMYMLFLVVFRAAEPASAAIDWLKGILAGGAEWIMPQGALRSLLVAGAIEGVGSVLVFLPQIMLLFLILGLLEDSGYLARASFLMDRVLSKVGLSGVSLIPLLSSFACAIPGIMSTRVITNQRERLLTILIAPLMSCSARLPVYVLLIAAFVPQRSYLGGLVGLQALTMLGLYLLGIAAAIGVAWLLKRFLFKHESESFVMEMPPYKVPQASVVFRRMFEGGRAFVRDAGTLIIAVSIVVWAAAYFPRNSNAVPAPLRDELVQIESQITLIEQDPERDPHVDLAALRNRHNELQNKIDSIYFEHSFLAGVGKAVEPVVRPLGWDWRVGSAVIASFPAREVVVSTMGVIFGLGSDADERSEPMRNILADARWENSARPLFSLPMVIGLLVFFALCAQCVSTLAVIKRETNSWRWPIFTFVYMTALAYLGALATYQIGSAIG